MLTGLSITNFKAFGGRHFMRFAPITLVFGTNSAGKSSIVQSLLLLKQTLASTEPTSVLTTRGELANLGTYHDISFQHRTDAVLEIAAFADADFALLSERLRGTFLQQQHLTGLGSVFKYDKAQRAIGLEAVNVYVDNPNFPISTMEPFTVTRKLRSTQVSDSLLRAGDAQNSHPFWRNLYESIRPKHLATVEKRLEVLRSIAQGEGAKLGVGESFIVHDMLRAELSLGGNDASRVDKNELLSKVAMFAERFAEYDSVRYMEDSLSYSNQFPLALRNCLPYDDSSSAMASSRYRRELRDPSLESILLRSINPSRFDSFHFDVSRFVIELSRSIRQTLLRAVYLGPLRDIPDRLNTASGVGSSNVGKSGRHLPEIFFRRSDLLEETNQILGVFGIPYEIAIRRLRGADVEDVFGLRLLDLRTKTTVSMLDVGFGISQVLPIIAQSLLTQSSTIMIEQPEIHVHPKLQAELGTLFARAIQQPRGNQFLIETHSEHLIRRLQRLVKQGELRPSDIAVLYVTRDRTGSQVHQISMDDDGDFLDEWPEGFFEEAYVESLARL
jgi:hypothetical protein